MSSVLNSRFLVFCLLMWAFPSQGASSGEEKPLSLSESLEIAAIRQPELRAAQAHAQASQAKILVGRSGFLPRLDSSLQYQRSTKNFMLMPSFASSAFAQILHPPGSAGQSSSSGVKLSNDTVNFLQAGANLTWMLFDFGQSSGQLGQAKAEHRRACLDLARLWEKLETRIRVAFYRTVAADAVVEVSNKTVANQGRHLQEITIFANAGTRPQIDLHSARLGLKSAKLTLLQASHESRLARIELNRAMGREPGEPIGSVQMKSDVNPYASSRASPIELEHLLANLDTRRNEIAALDADLAGGRANVRIAESNFFPRLSGLANFASTRVENLPWTYNWYAGFGLTWNLFAGAQTLGQKREARFGLNALHAQRETLLQSLRAEVTQRHLEVQEGVERRDLTIEAAAIARERLRLAEDRYRADLSSMLELEDAQIAEANAEVDRVRAGCQLAIAQAQLADAAGTIKP